MARQQERARRTRAALVESAAIEFARRGYAAASVNTILEGSNATKGAMYFHFQSKEELARAVLQAGVEQFTGLTERWTRRTDLGPFEALHCLVVDLAKLFHVSVIVQAEFRLIIEPEFYADVQSGGSKVWGRTAYEFAIRAQNEGLLREGADTEKFTRVLAASLAGQRYMSDLTELKGDLAERFEESLEVVLAAMASEQWLAKFAEQGWPECGSELPEL
ncbi:TetR/AcrR family transcriptional regulator [Rhodococcus tibetensis]|uniref:TetR family transcriptional regulator n=1 Tax=Rhodococcus tibetensis TaxID=2965064 RepID=A0ABT1Q6Q0_9NOCA|nr:TetR/AcrR family transcriptional regulator [Rhodococcus sp. FXJ9.536]MCQ4117916.1 TetR family transcriptional regulator [Rhodococcus sp. FXJ9.536]